MTRQKSARWPGVPGKGSQLDYRDCLWADTSQNSAGQETYSIGETNFSISILIETLPVWLCFTPEMCPHFSPWTIFCLQISDGISISFLLMRLEFSFGIWSHKWWNDFLFQTHFYFIYKIEVPSREILKPLVYNQWLFLMSWIWELQRKEADFIK